MNYLVQRGKVRSQVINVPEGLPELLSDITREVLRCQPTTECLCQFIIDYLHSIIVTREKARMAKSIIDRALRSVDEIISDMCICDIPKEKAELLSEAMEECFKHFLAKKRCELGRKNEIIKFGEIDLLDEMIQKCNFNEHELKISRPVIEAAYEKFIETYMNSLKKTDSTEALYQYFRERELERILSRKQSTAATIIQAAFRGYLVRRSLPNIRTTEQILEEFDKDAAEKLLQEMAARKIQNFFRHRINLKKFRENMNKEPDDLCSPESKVSLTPDKEERVESEQNDEVEFTDVMYNEASEIVQDAKEEPTLKDEPVDTPGENKLPEKIESPEKMELPQKIESSEKIESTEKTELPEKAEPMSNVEAPSNVVEQTVEIKAEKIGEPAPTDSEMPSSAEEVQPHE